LIVFAFGAQYIPTLIGGGLLVTRLPLSGVCKALTSLLYLSGTVTTSGLTPSNIYPL